MSWAGVTRREGRVGAAWLRSGASSAVPGELAPVSESDVGLVAVVGRFPPPIHGQAVATEVLADLLTSEGFRVARINETYRAEDDDRVQVRYRLRSWIRGALDLMHFIRRLRAKLRELDPDILVYASLSATRSGHVRNLLTYAFAFPRKVKIVAVVHNGDISRLRESPLTCASWDWLIARSRCVVALSPLLAARLRIVGNCELVTIPNTLDVVMDGPLHKERDMPAGLKVLFVGNLIPEKGVNAVLDAVEGLALRDCDIQLTIAGSSPSAALHEDVVQRCAALGSAHAHYIGQVEDRSELRALLRASHVLVLPSRYRHEALPMVIIEAMACGTPVIASSIGGIPDLVDDGVTGLLLGRADAGQIESALRHMSDAVTWTAMAQASRPRYEKLFSRDAVGSRWRDLLQGLGCTSR